MNSQELENLLYSNPITKNKFKGVYPSDQIPFQKRLAGYYIFNLDNSFEPGTHWISIKIVNKGKNIFFDSYGFPPRNKNFKLFMKNNYKYNRKELQHKFSTACGQWCLFFIYLSCKGKTLEKIVNLFNEKRKLLNDHFVNNAVEKLFSTKQKVIDKDFLIEQISNKMSDVLTWCPYYCCNMEEDNCC